MDVQQAVAWRGRDAVDANGGRLGKVDEIYLDTETEQPEWLAVKLGRFGGNLTFIPIAEASDEGGQVRVPYERSQIEAAPNASADGELSQEEEAALYRHYGLDYTERTSDSGLPSGGPGGDPTPQGAPGVVGNDVSGVETDNAMTRSEEEVRVGTRQVQTGRARLRKHVVTEPVHTQVTTRRDEVRVEREPITDANLGAATSGADLSEEEHEVVLTAEEAVVDKSVVPKERVRLDKDTIAEQQTVQTDVRKEQIDLIDGAGQPAEGMDGQRGTDEGIDRR